MEQGIKFTITGDTKGLENATETAKKEVEGLGSEIEQAKKKIEGYRKEMRSLRDEFKKGNITQQQYGQGFVKIEKNLRDTEEELQKLEKGLRDTTKQTENLTKATGKVDAPTKKTANTLEGLSGTLKNIPTDLNGVINSLDDLTSIVGASAALQVGVAALAAIWAVWGDEIQESIANTDEFAEATRNAVAEVQGERATMNALLAVARDENVERQKRVDAIKVLNDQYPELNNQLKLETINTQATTKAIEEATKAIENRAKIRAAENLISQEAEKVFQAQVDLEKQREDAVASALQAQLQDYQSFSRGIQGATFDYEKARTRIEERVNKEFASRLQSSEKDYRDYIKRLNAIIAGSDNLLDVFGVSDEKPSNEAEKEAKRQAAIIKKVNAQLFKDEQENAVELAQQTASQVSEIYKSSGGQALDLGISEAIKKEADETEAPILRLETSLKSLRDTLKEFDLEKIDLSGLSTSQLDALGAKLEQVSNQSEIFGSAIQAAFSGAASEISSAIQTGNAIIDGFVSSIIQSLATLGAAYLANELFGKALAQKLILTEQAKSNANAITIASSAAAAAGPFGIVAFPGLLASMLAQINGAFAGVQAIGAFAQGGIVGGGSFTGDQILARLNSGERVLTTQDQSLLTRFLRGETMGSTNQTGGLPTLEASAVIRGSDIYLAWSRAERNNKRYFGR